MRKESAKPVLRAARRARRGAGFTLVEAVLSAAIAAILMAGLAGAMLIAQKAMAAGSANSEAFSSESRLAQMIAQDVGVATAITERTSTAITLIVPDRNGDGNSETVRYAWSGQAGGNLTRQYNNGTPAVLATNVNWFNLTYLIKTP